mmetsp:Transcript_36961/g.105844  ORF Transcript_36961/g.105844 Transcript_36961/m.105844 type:complete len:94 (-) Transcript_36961:159-440(-)
MPSTLQRSSNTHSPHSQTSMHPCMASIHLLTHRARKKITQGQQDKSQDHQQREREGGAIIRPSMSVSEIRGIHSTCLSKQSEGGRQVGYSHFS